MLDPPYGLNKLKLLKKCVFVHHKQRSYISHTTLLSTCQTTQKFYLYIYLIIIYLIYIYTFNIQHPTNLQSVGQRVHAGVQYGDPDAPSVVARVLAEVAQRSDLRLRQHRDVREVHVAAAHPCFARSKCPR